MEHQPKAIELLRHDPRSFSNIILLIGKVKTGTFYTASELSMMTTITVTSLAGMLEYPLVDEPIIIDEIPYIKIVKDSLDKFGDETVLRTLRQYDHIPEKVAEYEKTGELATLGYEIPITMMNEEQTDMFNNVQQVHENIGMDNIRELLVEDDGVFKLARDMGLSSIDGKFIVKHFRDHTNHG